MLDGMKNTDKTSPRRTARYREKNLLDDLVRVNVWVPVSARVKLLEYAADLRKLQGSDER
jgi:hypothetical protein